MSDEITTTLEVHRTEIGRTRLVEDTDGSIEDGQVRLSVDRFAITANNITYAVFGDVLGYWDFFPTGDAEWGRVPAMGWATVVESRNNDIAGGGRHYGWFPMASHVIFTSTATADGFRDDGTHRAAHAPVYRTYVSTEADPMYPAATEGVDGSSHDWLRVEHRSGAVGAQSAWSDVYGGSVAPSVELVARIGDVG
jgi:hypothetical protein